MQSRWLTLLEFIIQEGKYESSVVMDIIEQHSVPYANLYQLVCDTIVTCKSTGDMMRHMQKIIYKDSYLEFIDSIIRHMLIEKIQNCLVDGYVDNSLYAGWTSDNFNPSTSFKSNILKSPVWHSLFQIIGKELFLNLIFNFKVYIKTNEGGYFQLCGREKVNKYTRTLVANPVEFTPDSNLLTENFILDIINDENVKSINILPAKYNGLLRISKLLDNNHKRINYSALYRHIIAKPKPFIDENESIEPTPLDQVIKFVLVIHGKLLGNAVWGTAKNVSLINSLIVNYVKLGEKAINFDLGCLPRFSIKSLNWAGVHSKVVSSKDLRTRMRIVAKFLNWYLRIFIRRLIYRYWKRIMVNNNGKEFMDYYPISHWRLSTRKWLNDYSEAYLYPASQELLTTSSLQNNFVGSIKLVPKPKGFRMLCIPMKARPLTINTDEKDEAIRYGLHIKRFIRPLQFLLNAKDKELIRHKNKFHPRSYSNVDVAQHIHDFRLDLIARNLHSADLFFVKFDMKRCYDNINHEKLLECVDNLFNIDIDEEKYYVRQVRESSMFSDEKERRKFVLKDTNSIETLDPEQWEYVTRKSNPKAITDRSVTNTFTKEVVKNAIADYVTNSGIFLSGDLQLFKRKIGIFQGFPLSATLCNIFYNQLVDNVLSFTFERPWPSILIRLADDFLFISTSKVLCQEVYDTVNGEEFKLYGGYVNEEKTCWYEGGLQTPNTTLIKFVGLDIDTKDLSIKTTKIYNPKYLVKEKCQNYKQFYTFMIWWYRLQLKTHVISLAFDTLVNQFGNLEKIWETLNNNIIDMISYFKNQGMLVSVENHAEFLLNLCEITLKRWTQVNKNRMWNKQILDMFKKYLLSQRSVDEKIAKACCILNTV